MEVSSSSFEADLAECVEHDVMIAEALEREVSLRDYSKQVEQELAFVEAESMRDYVSQSSRVAALHEEMRRCEEGLGRIQETVGRFSELLGGVASEVRRVQEANKSMSVKLANRSRAEAALAAFLRRLVLPSDAERVVEEREVFDEVFVGYAALVDARLDELGREPRDTRRYVAAKHTLGGAETRSRLEGLKAKLVHRIREALLGAVGELKALPQQTSSAHKLLASLATAGSGGGGTAAERALRRERLTRLGGPLLAFLAKRASPARAEVRQAYVDSAGRALHALLKAYNDELAKHELLLANRHDLVAVEESAVRSTMTSRVSLAKRGDAFSIGERDSVLRDFDAPPLRAAAVRAEKAKLPLEVLFRSSLKRLREACGSERVVTRALFEPGEAEDVFAAVTRRAAATTVDYLETRTKDGHDVVGLALVAKLCAMGRADATATGLDLARFYDDCDAVVWPRVRAILEANLESARRANPAKLGGVGLSPHYVTRRFAELAALVLALFPEARDDLAKSVTESLRDEILTLLAKLAREQDSLKDRVVFLANNYDQVITVLDQRLGDARDLPLRRFFDQLLARQRDAYVDATLDDGLGRLVAFVKQTERHIANNALAKPLDPAAVQTLAADFAAAWEPLLAAINNDVLASFSNFVNGTQVLKQCFTQLLVYYTRFQDIVKLAWRRPPPFVKDFVSTATILAEIKQYTRSFS